MLNHDLFRSLLSFCSVVICLQTLVTVGSILLCMHVKEMEWSDKKRFGAMPRRVSYGNLPKHLWRQGKGR